jgi:hypothetical protein
MRVVTLLLEALLLLLMMMMMMMMVMVMVMVMTVAADHVAAFYAGFALHCYDCRCDCCMSMRLTLG